MDFILIACITFSTCMVLMWWLTTSVRNRLDDHGRLLDELHIMVGRLTPPSPEGLDDLTAAIERVQMRLASMEIFGSDNRTAATELLDGSAKQIELLGAICTALDRTHARNGTSF